MLFNSFEFLIFILVVFAGYWFLFAKNLKAQNLWILVSSYVFYAWWDWRFLGLIFGSSIIDYIIGSKLHQTSNQTRRKILLITSVTINVGVLCFFKYYNFFIESLLAGLTELGVNVNSSSYTLNIIIPIGISFYTFQTLSYTIDIFKKRIEPSTNLIAYLAFVSFFPQLLAGPIERAKKMMPQFENKRSFDIELAKDGMRQILWGLFKKVVIADPTGVRVNFVFENFDLLSSSNLLLGVFLYTFQLYMDFSAYSDIAIGLGKLFGIRLSQNFRYPFFSIDFGDFWTRWHITLSSWFRDYVYFPLGGLRNGMRFRNITIVFILMGLWHDSNDLNGIGIGLLLVPATYGTMLLTRVISPNVKRIAPKQMFPSIKQVFQMLLVFLIFSHINILFRAESFDQSIAFIHRLFSFEIVDRPIGFASFLPIGLVLLIEWFNKHKEHPLKIDYLPQVVRWGVYYLIIFFILKTQIDTSPYLYYKL